MTDPLTKYPRPPFEEQPQGFPGKTGTMSPEPDHGEASYRGSRRLKGKAALVTGGDSGIGRAVALAYSRQGAALALPYNVFGPFYVTKAAMAHLKPGASVIFTSSVNAKHPMPSLLAYSATKGALSNMVLSLAQLLAEKGVRVNGVLPGPIWTPFIPAGMDQDAVRTFGTSVPFGRPGQPAELASAYVMLASQDSSFTSGALITVAGAMPVF